MLENIKFSNWLHIGRVITLPTVSNNGSTMYVDYFPNISVIIQKKNEMP